MDQAQAYETDRVYVAAKSMVYAVEIPSGRTLWQTSIGGATLFGNGVVTLLVVGGYLVVGRNGQLFILDKANGGMHTAVSLPGSGWGTPMLAADTGGSNHAAASAQQQQQANAAAAATIAAAASVAASS